MSGITLVRLRRSFDRDSPPVVADFDLEIPSGIFFSLLGPSGCGKTTVLRMIAGLDSPDDGDILIDGRSVISLGPTERGVALVFQQYALYPNMSVAENLRYPLRSIAVPRPEQDKRIRETARWLGIGELLERYPSALSGGEQQRVAIGRAMIREPRIALLDEPLANLDPLLRLQTRAELKSMQRDLGITTVMVTHDQSEALAVSDQIAVMQIGRLAQVGTADEIYVQPATSFVASFIGDPPMNLVHGFGCDGDFCIDQHLRIAVNRMVPDGPLEMGIRPESIRLSTVEQDGWLLATTQLVEPQGHEVIVTMRLGPTNFRVRNVPHPGLSAGQMAFVHFNSGAMHFFSSSTGNRITV
ncbi:sn-glycerol-3-phosphate ABC transporter ATP-binding protein UgpC [soil metagenome]